MKKNKLHEIIQELKKENLQDIESLYENYAQTVKNIAFSVLKDAYDSEDVMQEVFVKIHKMERKNLPNTGEWNWIYLVTKNTAIDFIKKRKKTICIEEIYNYKNTNDEIEKFISKTSCEKLFVNLSEKEKEILTLKIFSGFSFKEIGFLTNYPTSTVSWKYYKSMDILKSNIKKEFISFILLRFMTLLIENICLYLLIDLLNLQPMISKVCVSFITILSNYILCKFKIFKEEGVCHG